MLFILDILSQVVISHICFTNVDSTWRQDICTQLARAWDTANVSFNPLNRVEKTPSVAGNAISDVEENRLVDFE